METRGRAPGPPSGPGERCGGAVEPPSGEFEKTRASVAMKSPSEPTADEVERHEAAGHLPFRA